MKEDNISVDLDLERIQNGVNDEFVPTQFEWLEIEEQKIKAKKLESIKYKKNKNS